MDGREAAAVMRRSTAAATWWPGMMVVLGVLLVALTLATVLDEGVTPVRLLTSAA